MPLQKNICHNEQNVTRFIIVSNRAVYEKKSQKVSVCFELPHERRTLIICFPILYITTEYVKDRVQTYSGKNLGISFLCGFPGESGGSGSKKTLSGGLEAEANRVRVLGNYGLQEEA